MLQHLVAQREAVHELCRIVRSQGLVLFELYNQWNAKTIYKNLRMSRYRKLLNYPFRLIFRSVSPFAEWGLSYDRYNNWFELKRWLTEGGMSGFEGRGVGFGYHKYFFEPLYVNAYMEKYCPAVLQRYYDACLEVERIIGGVIPLRYLMEKFVMRARKNNAA